MNPPEERRRPEAEAVTDERHPAEAEHAVDHRPGPVDQLERGPVPQLQALHPGKEGIGADGERDPLHRVAEDLDQAESDYGASDGYQQVSADSAKAAAREEREHGERRQNGGRLLPQFLERRGMRGSDDALALAPHGLFQSPYPDRHQQAREPHGEEGDLPADEAERRSAVGVRVVPAVDDLAADQDAEAGADVDAARVHRGDRGSQPRRVVVPEHGERRRPGARFADADADPVGGEGSEAAGGARQRGHQAPRGQADRDQALAGPHVGQAADRNPEDGVEDGERCAVEEAELGVADAEVVADVLGEDREDLTVDEVEDVDQDEDAQDVVGVPPAGRLRGWGLAVLVC